MTTGGTDIQNRLDSFADSILFSDFDKRLKVDINIILVLSSCVVDQNVNIINLWKRYPITDITDIMSVVFAVNR